MQRTPFAPHRVCCQQAWATQWDLSLAFFSPEELKVRGTSSRAGTNTWRGFCVQREAANRTAAEVQADKTTIEACRPGTTMLDTLANRGREPENDPLLGRNSRYDAGPSSSLSAS